MQVKNKKKLILGIALVAAVFMAGALAQSFFFIFNETPFSPNQYNWQAPFEIKEMVDFVDATLTLTGCGYEGQSHDVQLVIENVATVSGYYLTAFDYSAKWYMDEANQENIIAGTYAGDPIGVSESVIYADVWVPTVIGIGVVKLNIIDIEWVQGEAITWTTEVIDNTGGMVAVSDFVVDCVNSGLPGVVSFKARYTAPEGTFPLDYTVEIVELTITVADVTGKILTGGQPATLYEHSFDPLPSGGSLTMRLTVSNS